MLVLKNIISCVKRNESGSWNKVSCLKKGGEMNSFCLKQGQGLKGSAAILGPNFPSAPPPPTHTHTHTRKLKP